MALPEVFPAVLVSGPLEIRARSHDWAKENLHQLASRAKSEVKDHKTTGFR